MNFCVKGNKILIFRYKVSFGKDEYYAVSKEEAEYFSKLNNGSIESLDTSKIEWADGIEFIYTKTPYEDAMKIISMGEKEYKNQINKPNDFEKLKSNIDYISMMAGIEIPTN